MLALVYQSSRPGCLDAEPAGRVDSGASIMHQTIRNCYRVLPSFVQQNEARALQPLTGQYRVSGTYEKQAGRIIWGEIKDALIAIAIFASLAVAVVVFRLVAFQPGFVDMLERAGRLQATGPL
jgi:hypothetical protein